jgi:hypothetical protein
MAAGIFTVVAGLPEHATKKLAAPLAQASTLCSFLVEDIRETRKLALWEGQKSR